MNRKFLALLLVVVLTCSISLAFAQVVKDEVVYAALNADGSVKDIYVVNTYEADEISPVKDYGVYTRSLPLGKAEGFAYENGETTFTLEKGRFAYQGNLESKELPWQIGISYTLDGQPVDALSLSGASGQVQGTIKVAVNPAYQSLANSLSLQISVTLNGDKSLNVIADKATLAHAAGNLTLAYVVLPGHSAEYTFSLDATDFAMPAIQIAGVRMGMDEDMYKEAAAKAMAGTPFETTVGNLMGGFLTAMQGQPVTSFTDSRNQVRAVQFVMMTEEIPQKPADTSEAAQPAEGAGSFFERLGKLLGL